MFLVFESIFDKWIIIGYPVSSFLWGFGIMTACLILLAVAIPYFVFRWYLGQFKYVSGDKEMERKYKKAKKAERKEMKDSVSLPVRRVVAVKRTFPWSIPVLAVTCVVSMLAVAVLPVIWDQLMVTLSGSHVKVIDTETSKQAAAEAR